LQNKNGPCDFCTNSKLNEIQKGYYEWEYKNPITQRTYSLRDSFIDWPDGRKLRMEIATDITELKEKEEALLESENRYRLALKAAEEGIWDWELESNKVFFSAQWKSQIGYQEDELENKFEVWQQHLHPEDYDAAHDELNAFLVNPKGKFTTEFRLRHKDGSYRWIRNRSAAQLNDEGEVIRMFGAHTDITQHKEQNEQLLFQKQKAEQADMFKSAFLANMSHDLRTPLNSIIGFSELMELTDDKEDHRHYRSIIRQNGQILLNLVNDIIDISKIEAGKLKLFKSQFNINEFLDRIDEIYQERLQSLHKTDVEILKVVPIVNHDIVLNTDEARLFQIFTNLINNSLKFTDQGSIQFGYKRYKGMFEFFVIDTGIGIPKEQLDTIFERFGQVNDTLTRNKKGSGLGLTICQQLTEILGGQINIESELDQGTSITFTFPASRIM
jgi:PAS domain S-box-containing protein